MLQSQFIKHILPVRIKIAAATYALEKESRFYEKVFKFSVLSSLGLLGANLYMEHSLHLLELCGTLLITSFSGHIVQRIETNLNKLDKLDLMCITKTNELLTSKNAVCDDSNFSEIKEQYNTIFKSDDEIYTRGTTVSPTWKTKILREVDVWSDAQKYIENNTNN